MCVHTWVLLGDKAGDRFWFRCCRCRGVVSLGFVDGVVHANIHAERGPVVRPDVLHELVNSVLRASVVVVPSRRNKRRKAA